MGAEKSRGKTYAETTLLPLVLERSVASIGDTMLQALQEEQ